MAEQTLKITGGQPLHGEVCVQGAKNSALPMMAAAMLCKDACVLHNVPQLTDVWAASRILNSLGCSCVLRDGQAEIRTDGIHSFEIPDEDMRRMRSSIMFLGPILGRMGACTLTMPGGCELGPRPIDLHLDAMRKMGVHISEQGSRILCRAEGLHGARITLPFPSVGVSENVMMAAVLAKGETVLTNAAREPEIVDIANFLNQCGAQIHGAGESTICIQGVKGLHGTSYAVMADRIAAITWMCAAAATGGRITVSGVNPADLEAALAALESAGCRLGISGNRIYLDAGRPLRAVRYLRTMPHPGFPTDGQAIMMAVLACAEGTSVIEETIFESRFMHVGELLRMGARIRISGHTAVVHGVSHLHGAELSAMDLRGGAALAVAAVGAQGETLLHGLHHIDRGYENFAETFNSLGGKVQRILF